MEQILHAQGLFHVFVRIDRRDASAGGAKLFVCQPLLLHDVLHLVVGHADDGPAAELQIVRRDGDARLPQRFRFVAQMLQIHHHAVADDIDGGLPQDARGQQIQDELALFVDHGVAGVVAALVAADDVVALGEQVHHAALAFVAPVDSYDRCQHN